LLEFGRDEKSGAYVYRSTVVTLGADTPNETAEQVQAQESTVAESAQRAERPERAEGKGKQRDSRRKERDKRKASREMPEPVAAPVHEELLGNDNGREAPVFGGKVFADEEPEDYPLPFAAGQEDEPPRVTEEPEATVTQLSATETQVEGEQATPATPARKRGAGRKTAAKKAKRPAATKAVEAVQENNAAEQETQGEAKSKAAAPRKTAARKSTARSRRPRKAATAETE
jgi:hypothetical protein